MCCFQNFQLTILVVKGPSDLHPVLTVSLNGITIGHKKVKGAVACVQAFWRHRLLKQSFSFSQTGISMLNIVITAADAVRHISEIDPWGAIGTEVGPVIADLTSC